MSDTNNSSMCPPKYDGKGGQCVILSTMQFKAWLASKGASAVITAGFNATLPPSEAARAGLDSTIADQKKQIDALDENAKGMYGIILAMTTPSMMHKIILEQKADADWPTGKFNNVWNKMLEDEQPDDETAEYEMEEDLRKIRLPKKKDPKVILEDIAAIEIQYAINLMDKQRAALVLRVGRDNYPVAMTITNSQVCALSGRGITAKELNDAMHKQWRVTWGTKTPDTKKCYDDGGHETAPTDVDKTGDANHGAKSMKCYHCGSDKHYTKD